ncbi:hypothetical protein HLH37_000060 [Salmonella enterica]|nr:hypothetical protein [Salmonella enterica]
MMNFPFFLAAAVSPIDSPRQAAILRSQAFSPCRALQKLFYKNGDAFCDVGWDDNLVLNADPAT